MPQIFSKHISPNMGHVKDPYVDYCTLVNCNMMLFHASGPGVLSSDDDSISGN